MFKFLLQQSEKSMFMLCPNFSFSRSFWFYSVSLWLSLIFAHDLILLYIQLVTHSLHVTGSEVHWEGSHKHDWFISGEGHQPEVEKIPKKFYLLENLLICFWLLKGLLTMWDLRVGAWGGEKTEYNKHDRNLLASDWSALGKHIMREWWKQALYSERGTFQRCWL